MKFNKFSLIELTVVLSLLAILASLLMPSISKMLIASKGVVCINHQKTIGLAFSNYIGDNTKYPNFRQAKSTSLDPKRQHTVFWDDLLGNGYDGRNLTTKQMDKGILLGIETAGAEMYACPLDDSGLRTALFPSSLNNWSESKGNNKQGKPRSYAMNIYRSGNWNQNENKQSVAGIDYQSLESSFRFIPWSMNASQVTHPSQLFLLGENPNAGYVGASWTAYVTSPKSQEAQGAFDFFQSRGIIIENSSNILYHNSGWNYLFVDGHVENLLPENTLGNKSNATLNDPKGGYWTMNPDD